jgi:hypothetical protein
MGGEVTVWLVYRVVAACGDAPHLALNYSDIILETNCMFQTSTVWCEASAVG